MDLSDALRKRFSHHLDNLVDGVFKSVSVAFFRRERTKLTRENTDIGIVDVAVVNVACEISILLFADGAGEYPERVEIVASIQVERFSVRYSLPRLDFLCDASKMSWNQCIIHPQPRLEITLYHAQAARAAQPKALSDRRTSSVVDEVVHRAWKISSAQLRGRNGSTSRMADADPEKSTGPDQDIDDVELMRLVGEGDTIAFERLIARHQTLVAGTVARMLGSSSDVEDVSQQVFIRVWKSAARYVPTAKFTTWLLKITRNLVFNEMRRTRRHTHVPLQPNQRSEEIPLRDQITEGPVESLLERELQGKINDAIESLPAKQRLALVLRRYQDLSYEEIAEVLDLSVPAVKSILFRARTELRERLRHYLDG